MKSQRLLGFYISTNGAPLNFSMRRCLGDYWRISHIKKSEFAEGLSDLIEGMLMILHLG